jgi:hypothetical protein
MSLDLIAMHMGALHPAEKFLTLLLAFGPFVVLGSVVAMRRRHEADDEPAERSADVHLSA